MRPLDIAARGEDINAVVCACFEDYADELWIRDTFKPDFEEDMEHRV
jgi:hypothetical protein